jgi:hypothetical protein
MPEDEPLDAIDEELINLLLTRDADRIVAAQQGADISLDPTEEKIIGRLFGEPVPLVFSRNASARANDPHS